MIKDTLRNEINALLDLLDDPDSSVYESVYKRFMQIGPATSEILEDALSMSLDDGYQKRIEYILDDISKNHALNLSENWLQNNPNDILEGYLIFTRYQYPNLNTEEILNQVEALRINIWMELNENLTALETVRIINHILFKVHRFEKDTAEISNPKYNYLNQVLQSKTYTHCSIALLYLILTKKLELPIKGVLYKGSPILCYVNDINKKTEEIVYKDVLFYIDPYNFGNVIPKDILKEIGSTILPLNNPKEMLPVVPSELILKTIYSTALSEKENDNHEKSEDLMYFHTLLKTMSEK